MAVLLGAAVLMIVLGSTIADEWLAAHLLAFFAFWGVCGWLTVTALLLAVFDLLIIRVQARAARNAFRSDLKGE